MKKFLTAKAEKSETNFFVASDESVDRHGDKLKMENWDLKNYKKAPRLLVDHWPSVEKIVGKGKVWIEGKKLMLEPIFHDITELARTTKAMVEQGVLDTVSVGYIQRDELMELLEISFVAIPANVNARMQKALEAHPEALDVEKIKDFLGEPNMAAVLDTLNELKSKIQSIESLIGSMAHPVPKKQEVVKARRQAKLTVKTVSALNVGLRNLLNKGGAK